MSDEEISRIVHGEGFRFEEAVSYFDKKVPVTAGVFYDLADHYRDLAFTVSGYTEAQIIKKFYDELLDALENGITMEQFRQSMSEFLERQGYEGLTPFQADNIFRTNIQTAYQAGHYEQMTDPDVMRLRPYWQYDAVNDSHTRPSHLAMDGRIVQILPDPSFRNNPAKRPFKPDLDGYPEALKRAYRSQTAKRQNKAT